MRSLVAVELKISDSNNYCTHRDVFICYFKRTQLDENIARLNYSQIRDMNIQLTDIYLACIIAFCGQYC